MGNSRLVMADERPFARAASLLALSTAVFAILFDAVAPADYGLPMLYALERRLFDEGRAAVVLDGQNMRRGISKDLGFTADERSENLRRSAEVAKLFNDAGIIVLAAFVAPDPIKFPLPPTMAA